MAKGSLTAGAATRDITPKRPMFLYGYPHVERQSEGVHDPLCAAALVLDNGHTRLALCAADLIFVSKATTAAVRRRVRETTGIPEDHVLVSCTHTHSGPVTVYMISNRSDPVVPQPDAAYLDFVAESLAEAVAEADATKVGAEVAITTASGRDVGGNRRVPDGPTDPEVPVIAVRRRADHRMLALATTYCMHPTVLHEDSRLYSADFPGYARETVRRRLGRDVVHLYHTGPEGDQSPRHAIQGNTFSEAERLGGLLGTRIVEAVEALSPGDYAESVSLGAASSEVTLEPRAFPPPDAARQKLAAARQRLQRLRDEGARASEIRTAECDVFGAEEAVSLGECAADGTVGAALRTVLPAEVQVFEIAGRCFACLPGEWFVEYSLEMKHRSPVTAFVLCLANGELQGYIATEAAAAEGGYEASNALFPPAAGDTMLNEAVRLIENLRVQ